MASFDELVSKQKQTGERIETIIRNFKKDPATRKESTSYFQERLRRLDEEWATFETTDNQIRLLDSIPLEHKYFSDNYYQAIMDVVSQYKELFERAMLKTATSEAKKPSASQQQTNQCEATIHETGEIIKNIRRQAAMMTSLERLLADDFTSEDIAVAMKLWQNIEDLHYNIAELSDDPVNQGYNIERFIQLETKLRKTVKTLTINSSSPFHSGNNNSQSDTIAVPIPKITLPKFDGNYLKWKEFHDLFSSLIVMQPIPSVQKIWYLKTHLVGEAANLIKHFTATGENFEAAWAVVIDRYNNKRLLVDKLVQELVDAPSKTTSDHYKSLHDKTQECLLLLNNLQIDTSSWDPLLLHLLLKRLDQTTRLRYEQSLSQPRDVPTIKEFLNFLEKNFQAMEAMTEKERSAHSKSRVCTSITSNRQAISQCILCKNGNHPLFACKTFLQQSPALRLQFVQKQKRCVNCLKPGHNANACSLRSCMKCNKKHNTLLHLESANHNPTAPAPQNHTSGKNSNQPSAASATSTTPVNQNAASLATSNHSRTNSYILLGTARIKVQSNNKEIQCRAILDSGSQINLISERLVKRLGISPKSTSICLSGVGSSNTRVQRRVNIVLQSCVNNFNTRLEAAVLTHIVAPQPSQPINIDKWPIPKNIALADPEFNRPDKIDILLGAEFYHQLLSAGQIKLGHELPILQNTLLGWVIAGKVGELESAAAVCGMCTEDDSNLENAVAQLRELDNLDHVGKTLSTADKHVEESTSYHGQNNDNECRNNDAEPTASRCQTNDFEIPKKRRRTYINHNLLTIIITTLLVPLVLGAQVHNTKFGKQLGIHFEGIGSAVISPSEWQLLVYYDLKGFWSELRTFSEGTKTLNQLCNEIQEKSTCANLVKYFEHTENELTMDSILLSGKRQKRGAVDFVGNIAHSLFGVLDSEYAKDMAQTISQVKENEAHLLNLLKNQTSIIDSTINIMKSDQEAVKKTFDQINFQIAEINNIINAAKEENHQERLYRLFSSLCIQLTITAANLQGTQLSIIDILTSTHHGIISPLLLTPHQLQYEVAKIRFHLTESLDLPVKQEDTLQLYKLMKVKGGLTENTVIFSVTLPLIERDRFDIFHLIPIPNWVNNTFVSIRPCSSFLIINSDRNQYCALSHSEFNSCSLLEKELYLCSKTSIRHEPGSTACSCEINLFYNKTQLDCPVQSMKDTSSWIPLYHPNKWIYAIQAHSQATAVCKHEITQLTLEGSGLLVLEPECTLKSKFMTLQGQQILSSGSNISYTSLWEITKQNHEKRLKPLLNEIHTSEYISQVKNLTTLQTALHEQKILQLPNKIDTHNYHHITVGYTSLIITVAILIYLLIRKRSKRSTTPTPMPRTQQPPSEFSVHI